MQNTSVLQPISLNNFTSSKLGKKTKKTFEILLSIRALRRLIDLAFRDPTPYS